MRVNRYYLMWAIILFIVELYIALFVKDRFIRPYFGDVLVVILIYAGIRAFFRYSITTTALGVLIFAFCVEFLQYFKFVEVIGLGDSAIARTVIGTTFVWEDLLAYGVGVCLLLAAEKVVGKYPHEWFTRPKP